MFGASSVFPTVTNVGGTNVPNLGLATEAVKFGDWDLDGDLDLVYANGGDAGAQSSKLLVNNGLAQAGTLGMYTNMTATNLVGIQNMSSRDVQPVDIDNDGDLDFYFSNHSMNGNQSNIWMVNQGGAQAGTAGVFVVDNSRWFKVSGPGSSVPAALKFTTGYFTDGFVDWSCQCDFADVDLDGDDDLYHSSYGSGFSALVMSRMFLNGFNTAPLGSFREYNPSSDISGNPNIASGANAGFLEGTHSDNTTNTSGANHDIANESLDIDFADLDGDFDNDVFANSRNTRSRFYQNRYFENGGSVGSEPTRLYRDLTGSWGVNITDAGNNYDADLHDMDNDNDVDGYFLNYNGSTGDGWATNNGSGVFTGLSSVPNSNNDDNEIDWHDYDNDGDVDPFVSAFSAADRFYRNQWVDSGSINLVQVSIGSGMGTRSLGADVGDMDNDGDTDIISGEDGTGNEVLLKNNGNVPDPIAPRVPNIFQVANGNTTSTPRRVVARAFDNVNPEYFKHVTGTLDYTVNGNPHVATAYFAGGNLFRATIPGYWYGSISYSMSVHDRVGNTGVSPTLAYTNTLTGFSTFGTETPGCHGTQTVGVNSGPTINNPDFAFTSTGAPPSTLGLCIVTDVQGNGSDPFALNIAMWVDIFTATQVYALDAISDPAGLSSAPAPLPNNPLLAGTVYYFQFLQVDGACGQLVSASPGGQITIQP